MALQDSGRAITARSTAEAMASIRAAGAAEPDAAVRNPDDLAIRFIRPGLRLTALVKIPPLRRLGRLVIERMVPGLYFYEIARVKHLDAVLVDELGGGIAQLVILGAGYDTRPYRFRDRLFGVRVFEVDHPATAALKRQLATKALGRVAEHVAYVEVDFERDDLAAALSGAGFDRTSQTLFISSGVAVYLTEAAVDGVLAFVRGCGRGSSIVFDYVYRAVLEGNHRYHGARQAVRRAAALGEPFLFGIEEQGAARFLAARDLDLVTDLGPDALADRYLRRSTGELHGRPYGFASIAHARVHG